MKKYVSLFLCMLLLFSSVSAANAADTEGLRAALTKAAAYVSETVEIPAVGATGGEWAILGLARSGAAVSAAYFPDYYENVEKDVIFKGGVLHEKKYTEYSRVILALTAIGQNPADVAGFNLLTPLGDYEKTIWQGVNGAIFALLALDSGGYPIPKNPDAATQATRDMYVAHILSCQNPDGGWALAGTVSDPDMTAMALQALAKYPHNTAVQASTEKALIYLSQVQTESGGFISGGVENAESCAQVLAALCELGISFTDARFTKNGGTIIDALLAFQTAEGGFSHTKGEKASLMSSEQGLYALAAAVRFLDGKSSLYHMTDTVPAENTEETGLSAKHPDVRKTEIIQEGKTFADIENHESGEAIKALAARGIINGKSENSFDPDATMTRAEFAAIVVRGLGLPAEGGAEFSDVTATDWFFDAVGTARAFGIVNGVSETEFKPHGTITREEAAVMTARAAALCGMQTELSADFARDILAGFMDYVKAADWAMGSLAFCVNRGILPEDAMEIRPKDAATRAEIADMLLQLLSRAKLL